MERPAPWKDRVRACALGFGQQSREYAKGRYAYFESVELPEWRKVGEKLPLGRTGGLRAYGAYLLALPAMLVAALGLSMAKEPSLMQKFASTYFMVASLAVLVSLLPPLLIVWGLLRMFVARKIGFKPAASKLANHVGGWTGVGFLVGLLTCVAPLISAGRGLGTRTFDPVVVVGAISALFAMAGVVWSLISQIVDAANECPTPALAPLLSGVLVWLTTSLFQCELYCTPAVIQRGLIADHKHELLDVISARVGKPVPPDTWEEVSHLLALSVPAHLLMYMATGLVVALSAKSAFAGELALFRRGYAIGDGAPKI